MVVVLDTEMVSAEMSTVLTHEDQKGRDASRPPLIGTSVCRMPRPLIPLKPPSQGARSWCFISHSSNAIPPDATFDVVFVPVESHAGMALLNPELGSSTKQTSKQFVEAHAFAGRGRRWKRYLGTQSSTISLPSSEDLQCYNSTQDYLV
jgi:hypothetical protein